MRHLETSRLLGWSIALLALALAGCPSGYDSEKLGLKYEPPNGFKFVREEVGPPAYADFGSGLRLYSLEVQTAALDANASLDVFADIVRKAAKLTAPAEVITSRTGSLPIGQVVRYELKTADGRELLYLIPVGQRTVLLTFDASEDRYGPLEARVESSLTSLHVHH
jgi:hypothetical protein